jgi:hypothetical protein
LTGKNKHALIRKFNPTSNKKKYHHLIFVQYKKIPINYFSLYRMKKYKRKEKKSLGSFWGQDPILMGPAWGMTQNHLMGPATIMGPAGPNTIGSCGNNPF